MPTDTEQGVWGKAVMGGMVLVFLLISILSSVAGSICGIGGGVIMKPILDAAGIMSVSGISFLSGCTVLAMSVVSVYKNMHGKRVQLQLKTVVILAVGAAAGGVMGKVLFQMLKQAVGNENLVGMVQAVVLAVITLGTLLYTVCKRRIHTLQCRQMWIVFLIGLLLGILSSFLGIGGGPVNIVILEYFFSMKTKESAASSLFVIMLSQAAGLVQTLWSGTVPQVPLILLAAMITGGMIGSKINRQIEEQQVNRLFMLLMAVIMGISIRNAVIFGGGV